MGHDVDCHSPVNDMNKAATNYRKTKTQSGKKDAHNTAQQLSSPPSQVRGGTLSTVGELSEELPSTPRIDVAVALSEDQVALSESSQKDEREEEAIAAAADPNYAKELEKLRSKVFVCLLFICLVVLAYLPLAPSKPPFCLGCLGPQTFALSIYIYNGRGDIYRIYCTPIFLPLGKQDISSLQLNFPLNLSLSLSLSLSTWPSFPSDWRASRDCQRRKTRFTRHCSQFGRKRYVAICSQIRRGKRRTTEGALADDVSACLHVFLSIFFLHSRFVLLTPTPTPSLQTLTHLAHRRS